MGEHDDHRARHRQRTAEKLQKSRVGPSDPDLLEFLIYSSVPRGDVRPAVERLMDRFGSLSALLDASQDELTDTSGVGRCTARLLALTGELSRRLEGRFELMPRIHSPEDAAVFLRPRLAGLRKDTFFLACLDPHLRIVLFNALPGFLSDPSGTVNRITRSLVGSASVLLLLFHAFPEGDPVKSDAELEALSALMPKLSLLNVTLLDYLLVSEGSFISLAREGRFSPSPLRDQYLH